MRWIDPSMSPAAVGQVDDLLAGIRRDEGVHIPLAIESGSRAWGFPSPDSDYDCRFVYVRPAAQALTVWPRRDVIETPLIGEMDVNGWDLAKALRLLLKGNAVVVEWLQSPIVYEGEAWFREALLDFARDWLDRGRVAAHYLHLGRRQKVLHLDDQPDAPLKKVFYTLRPAAALRGLRLHSEAAVAPMHFPTLLAESEPPVELVELVMELIARKAVTRESGLGTVPPALRAFIETELEAGAPLASGTSPLDPRAMAAADALFAEVTLRLDAEAKAVSPG